MLLESVLARGPLLPNANYVERNAKGQIVMSLSGKPICQEIVILLVAHGKKMQYTDPNDPPPFTLAGCHPSWDDYLDLGKTINEMAHRLIAEDTKKGAEAPTVGTTPQQEGASFITSILPAGSVMFPAAAFPGDQTTGSSRDNPVHLSDANDTSTSGGHPGKDTDVEDEAAILSHFSDALREMANSIMGLEEGYFKALCEVIEETERALRDVSRIDAHYVSQVVTVMSSWQEAIQVAATHMEGVDLTTYLTHLDTRRATHEYVKEVVKACEEHDAAHTVEHENRKEAIRTQNTEDPVVRLLNVTRKAACVHCKKAVDVFIDSIKGTLHKHIPTHSQGPLIANALSTAFQFQMAIWRMIGEECVHPIRTRHSDWCGLAGIVQAIVETFPKNCALMFPPMPMSAVTPSFTSTYKFASSDEDDGDGDDDTLGGDGSFRRFNTSTPTPLDSGRGSSGGLGGLPSFSSGSLPFGGTFIMASDNVKAAGGIPGDYEVEPNEIDHGEADEGLDLGEEAGDKGDGKKGRAKEALTEPTPDPDEMAGFKTIIKPGTSVEQPPAVPRTGSKRWCRLLQILCRGSRRQP